MQKKLIVGLVGLVLVGILFSCPIFAQPVPAEPRQYTALVLDREIVPLLKYYFPHAYVGVADTVYQTISLSEMERFLRKDPTNEMSGSYADYVDSDDFAWCLLGNMSASPGWARIPFGYVVRTDCGFVSNEDAVFFNIFVAKEQGHLVLYEINPMTDEIWKVEHPQPDVLIVVI